MRCLARQTVVASALCMTPLVSWAQHVVTVPVELLHLSNPNLTSPSEGSVSVVRVSPSLSFVTEDGSFRTEFSLGGVLERSSNTALSANRADPRLGVDWRWSLPTSQMALRASLRDTSTRSVEFDSTGGVTVDSTQRTAELGADWSRELTPLTRLAVGITQTQVDYRTPLLVGYRQSIASGAIEHALDDVSRISVEVGYGSLKPDSLILSPQESRSSLFLEYENSLSELWTIGLGAGTVRTDGEVRRNSRVGRLQLGYLGERLSSTLDWRREVAPSGTVTGYGRSDTYRWTNRYAVTAETDLELSTGRIKSLEVGGSTGRTAAILLRSSLSEFWTLSMAYEVRSTTPSVGPQVRGRTVIMGLTYSHPDF